MLCRWKAGTWTAVIVAIVVAIGAGQSHHEPRTAIVTFEEMVQ